MDHSSHALFSGISNYRSIMLNNTVLEPEILVMCNMNLVLVIVRAKQFS